MNDYERRITALDRNYKTLQRRTILYGLLATTVSMYIAVYLVLSLSLSALQGGVLGGCVGAFLVTTSSIIVRQLNPLVR